MKNSEISPFFVKFKNFRWVSNDGQSWHNKPIWMKALLSCCIENKKLLQTFINYSLHYTHFRGTACTACSLIQLFSNQSEQWVAGALICVLKSYAVMAKKKTPQWATKLWKHGRGAWKDEQERRVSELWNRRDGEKKEGHMRTKLNWSIHTTVLPSASCFWTHFWYTYFSCYIISKTKPVLRHKMNTMLIIVQSKLTSCGLISVACIRITLDHTLWLLFTNVNNRTGADWNNQLLSNFVITGWKVIYYIFVFIQPDYDPANTK